MSRRVLPIVLFACFTGPAHGQDVPRWPQFRGPNATGIAADAKPLPVEFGPDKNLKWKTPIPPGHSSPCVWGDCIFVTAFDKEANKLETIGLDRRDGRILWRKAAPAEKVEKVHATGSPAVATPATDGERVYVYFGSCGLFCYDFDGKEIWTKPLPTAQTYQ